MPLLSYEDIGQGADPPLLFLHGWGCDRSYLAAQVSFFARSRRVVSVDLPGHGQSRAEKAGSSVAAMADAVARLCREIGLFHAVLVGHSMGGAVATELTSRGSLRTVALILLDTVLFPSREIRDAVAALAPRLGGADHDSALDAACAALLLPIDDPAIGARYRASLGAMAPAWAAATFRAHLLDFAPERALAAYGGPAAYVGAENPMADLTRLREACPQIKLGQTLGSGHFMPLLVPEQVNALMAGFLHAYVTVR